jgi:hypothetical protein
MRRRYLVLCAVISVVAAGCSGGGAGPLPKVPPIHASVTSTTDLDYSDVPLRGVTGKQPTTTIAFGPGTAAVSGTVVGDEGPVAGASVLVERIVAGGSAAMTVISGADGTWALPQIFGGRYRVRAWRAPDLAQTNPAAVFLGATETKTVPLRVKTLGGLSVKSSLAPDPPHTGEDANLVVAVSEKTVDAGGIVRATPLDNVSVDLVGSAGWRVESANPDSTDSSGRVRWLLRCRQPGHQPLAVTVGTQTIPLDVSSCVEQVTQDTSPSTSAPGGVDETTTSTTRPRR